jgi:uncharacterized protein YjiS (DUF1127 family)
MRSRIAAQIDEYVRRIHSNGDACSRLKSILHIWWMRWRERRRFARVLPWLADEVLEDYGLTREQARWLCRRPFWRGEYAAEKEAHGGSAKRNPPDHN